MSDAPLVEVPPDAADEVDALRRALLRWAHERRRREVAEEKLADAEAYIEVLLSTQNPPKRAATAR